MFHSNDLQGACVWKGAEMRQNRRWIKEFPAAVLEQIDAAIDKAGDLDWRQVNRHNFPLPGATAFFDDVREELENGCGMVKMRGLDMGRYSEEQLRRIWYAIGCHLGTPMYQNRSGEMMRDIRDEGMGVGAKLYGATVDASGKPFLSRAPALCRRGSCAFTPTAATWWACSACARRPRAVSASWPAAPRSITRFESAARTCMRCCAGPYRAAGSAKRRAASM